MSILQTIDEQCSFGFTGRINVLKNQDGQFLGVVFMKEGKVVASQFCKKHGLVALYAMIIEDMESDSVIRLVVEPELIEDNDVDFTLDFATLKTRASKHYDDHIQAKKLKPPGDLRLMVATDFIAKGSRPSAIEFELIKTIIDYNKVDDIYKNSELLESEVTRGLVELRRKGALKVVSR